MSKLLVGTTKGLVILERRTTGWEISEVQFLGMPATYVYAHPYSGAWWVSLAHRHWGQKLQYSHDAGVNWHSVPPPHYPQDAEIRPGKSASLKNIWSIHHAGSENPEAIWLGTEPGGLFYKASYAASFELNTGLWNHPSRLDENKWFGAGRDYPFLHSIVVDPRDSQHIYVAVSCAGVFESTDGGKSWQPRNKGLIAAYLPNPHVEIGHDPHLVIACKANPDVLWQQNHCGIFRSTNRGESWMNVSETDGLAQYGFALAIDHTNPRRAWVIPAISDEVRVAPEMALSVCSTEDAGQTWTQSRIGLPQSFSFDIVFRHAFVIQDNVLAFGTTTGNLYLSEDYGNSWQCISSNLARIDCLNFA